MNGHRYCIVQCSHGIRVVNLRVNAGDNLIHQPPQISHFSAKRDLLISLPVGFCRQFRRVIKELFDFFRRHVHGPFFSRVNIRSGGALWNRTSSGATPPDAPAYSIKGAAHGRRPPMRAALCILSVPRRWDSRLSERPGRSSTPMLSTAWQACFGTPRPYGHRQPNADLMHNRISQNRTVTLH